MLGFIAEAIQEYITNNPKFAFALLYTLYQKQSNIVTFFENLKEWTFISATCTIP